MLSACEVSTRLGYLYLSSNARSVYGTAITLYLAPASVTSNSTRAISMGIFLITSLVNLPVLLLTIAGVRLPLPLSSLPLNSIVNSNGASW